MSSEPERAIEKEIRTYVERRRNAAGDTFEINDDQRRELLKEAERLYPKSILCPTTFKPGKTSIIPLVLRRVALFIPLAALLVITTKVWIERRMPIGDTAKIEMEIGFDIETSPLPPEAKNFIPPLAKSTPSDEQTGAIDNIDLESIREPALPANGPSFSYRKERASVAPPMPRIPSAPKPSSKPADSLAKDFKITKSPEMNSAREMTKSEKAASTTVLTLAAPETAVAPSKPSVSIQKYSQIPANVPKGSPTPPAEANVHFANFEISQNQNQLELSTSSGSRLLGKLHINYSPPAQPTPASLLERLQQEVRSRDSLLTNLHLYFSVSGSEGLAPMVFKGNFVPMKGVFIPAITNLKQFHIDNYHVQGQATIGTNSIFINARPSGN
ncbi:hypothetical protein N9B94_03685 [Verrucomicrobia bacterium]|nr:hypothetical protein [Verrucomicrobiota bacterium]MDB4458952.1 hypothetical protein [bacterium]